MKKERTFAGIRRFLAKLPERQNKKVAKARDFWIQFLARAPKTRKEWDQAKTYAANWDFCACGTSLPKELRRNNSVNELPKDDALYYLGSDFSHYVERRDYQKARKIFLKIQNREAELLNELKIKNPSFN